MYSMHHIFLFLKVAKSSREEYTSFQRPTRLYKENSNIIGFCCGRDNYCSLEACNLLKLTLPYMYFASLIVALDVVHFFLHSKTTKPTPVTHSAA